MWSCNRRTLLILALGSVLGAVAACGFTPAYAPGGAATKLQSGIAFDAPIDKDGFDMVERLEQRLGRSQAPLYKLAYRTETTAIGVGITPDAATTRFNITGSATYTVTDRGTDVVLTSGTVQSFTAYSATGTTVSTLTAQRDASSRLMRLLADQIVARLIATSGAWAK